MIKTSENESEYQYFTPSHRWGLQTSSEPIKLTRTTEGELTRGLNVSKLPKTFQDAVDVTRRLGKAFLWIDSLCIMQEDQDDWFRESALMGNIYMHGDCNLSALAASSDSDGLYQQRRRYQTCARTEIVLSDQPYAPSKQCVLGSNHSWESRLEFSELNRRGWVLQERVLSKRVLHFSAEPPKNVSALSLMPRKCSHSGFPLRCALIALKSDSKQRHHCIEYPLLPQTRIAQLYSYSYGTILLKCILAGA